MDTIFDGIAEEAEDVADLPGVVQGLVTYLGAVAIDCAWTITAIEERHPDRKEAFASERRRYNGE
jgi:hypothetical protein